MEDLKNKVITLFAIIKKAKEEGLTSLKGLLDNYKPSYDTYFKSCNYSVLIAAELKQKQEVVSNILKEEKLMKSHKKHKKHVAKDNAPSNRSVTEMFTVTDAIAGSKGPYMTTVEFMCMNQFNKITSFKATVPNEVIKKLQVNHS